MIFPPAIYTYVLYAHLPGSPRWPDVRDQRRLMLVIASNGMLRVAGGASSVLVGVYVAELANRGRTVGAGLVATLAAISSAVELLGALPLGMLSDAVSARTLMTTGALLAAAATWLFGVTEHVSVFVVSRALEGLSTAAGVPALLAHVTDVTAADARLRSRAMSYFELSLLAGLALGGVAGGQLWSLLHAGAFVAVALLYASAASVLFIGSVGSVAHRRADVWQGLARALKTPALRRLAPVWLCMNAIIGLWLGPTLYFLLTNPTPHSQLLTGLFTANPGGLGWLLFVYSLVFGTGVLVWSRVLPRIELPHALRVSLVAMLAVSVCLLALNHMTDQPMYVRWTLTAIIALLIMVESGFTPAALSLLARAVGPGVGRGSAMGIYSFLLGVGTLIGSVLAGVAGRWLAVDGLIYVTLALAVLAFGLLSRLRDAPAASEARA
jgi:MFS family permease